MVHDPVNVRENCLLSVSSGKIANASGQNVTSREHSHVQEEWEGVSVPKVTTSEYSSKRKKLFALKCSL